MNDIIKIKRLKRIPLAGSYNKDGINFPIGAEYKLDIDVKLKVNAKYIADDGTVYTSISDDTIRCGGFCDEPKEIVCTFSRQGEGLDILGEGMVMPLNKSNTHEIGKRAKGFIEEYNDEWIKAKEEEALERLNKQIVGSAMAFSSEEAEKMFYNKALKHQQEIDDKFWYDKDEPTQAPKIVLPKAKACPFCGGEDMEFRFHVHHGHGDSTYEASIFCKKCGGAKNIEGGWGVPQQSDELKAWEQWNERI